jgi:hypothetical protein
VQLLYLATSLSATVLSIGVSLLYALMPQMPFAEEAFGSKTGSVSGSYINSSQSSAKTEPLSCGRMKDLSGGWTSYSECTRGKWHEYGCTDQGCYYDSEYGQNCIRTELLYYHCGPSQTKDCVRMNSQTCAFKKLYVGYIACFDYKSTVYVQTYGCQHRTH